MRWYDFLIEGPAALMSMYSGIPENGSLAGDVQPFLNSIEKDFKRKDRIIWFVRWHRIWYASLRSRGAIDAGYPDPINDKVRSKFASAVKLPWDQAVTLAEWVLRERNQFKHFIDLPIAAIQNYDWQSQRPNEILNDFAEIERAWRERASGYVALKGNEEIIMEFPDGYVWWNLNRGGCRDEANAMGHCGNGDGGPDEVILSLRKKIDDTFWEPALTFIYNEKYQYLGEMKGRGNDKPVARYHPYIVALLKHPMIKEIRGGGYLPQNNFSLNDLDPEVRANLLAEKPELKDVYALYDDVRDCKGEIPYALLRRFEDKLEEHLTMHGSYESVDVQSDTIVIDEMPASRYTSLWHRGALDHMDDLLDGLDELAKLVQTYDPMMTDETARAIEEYAREQHYWNLFDTLIDFDHPYILPVETKREGEKGKEKVIRTMAISSYLSIDDDDLSYVANERSLLVCHDGWDDPDPPGTDDDFENAVIDYCIAQKNGRAGQIKEFGKVVAELAVKEYEAAKRAEEIGNRDPNQLSFDF